MANPNDRIDWTEDDAYWRENYRKRPYASSANQDYTYYQPGYRYGYEAANRHQNRTWSDVESELSSGWNKYEHRGSSTWEHVKDAVRDAWDRVMGRHPVGTR
jgi:hypothetical protein